MIQDFYILMKLLREFNLPKEKRDFLVTKRLERVLCSAYNNTKYYKKLMDDSEYNPNVHYKDPDDLKKLRITTKKDLKENPVKDFINESAKTKVIFTDSTSGSTGIPLKVYRNSIERKYQVAKWLRVLFLNGYNPFHKVLSITSPARLEAGKSFLQNLGLLRRKAIDYLLDQKNMVDEIVMYQPSVIYGNRSHFDMISNEIIKRDIKFDKLKMIMVGGEVINNQHIDLYRKAFNCKFIQIYGSVELGSIAFDISGEKGMFLNDDLTYFEFIDKENNEVDENKPGKVIGTDLIGEFMPLIRYDQGDTILYRVNNNRRRIYQINGRNDDIIITPSGLKKSFHFLYELFNHYQDLIQFQVIQKSIKEIVILLDCKKEYFHQIYDKLLFDLRKNISYEINYTLILESPIQPDKTGKIRMFKSELKTDEQN